MGRPSKSALYSINCGERVSSSTQPMQLNLLGTYQGRGDANKALKKIAYAPEPQRQLEV